MNLSRSTKTVAHFMGLRNKKWQVWGFSEAVGLICKKDMVICYFLSSEYNIFRVYNIIIDKFLYLRWNCKYDIS